jgi:hypothetical protein
LRGLPSNTPERDATWKHFSQKFRQERRQSRRVVKDGSMPWSDIQVLQDWLREADDALERA